MDTQDKTFVYNIAKSQLDAQIASIDSFTTKAGLVLATCGVIFTGYLQLLSSDSWSTSCDSWFFILEILLISIAGLLAFLSLAPGGEYKPWKYDPEPEKLYKLISDNKNSVDIEDEVTRSMIASYRHNKELIEEKFSMLQNSRYALCASGAVFFIHLLIYLH